GLPRGRLDVLTARRLVAAAVRVPVTPEVELAGAGGVARVGLEQDRSLVALIGVPRRATERGGDQLPVVDVAVEEVGVLLGEDVRPGVARLVLRHPVVVVADLERGRVDPRLRERVLPHLRLEKVRKSRVMLYHICALP